jgi:hypothetical protein
MQRRHKERRQRRFVGGALVLLQPAHLRFAVAHSNRQLALGQARPLPEKAQELAEGSELFGLDG